MQGFRYRSIPACDLFTPLEFLFPSLPVALRPLLGLTENLNHLIFLNALDIKCFISIFATQPLNRSMDNQELLRVVDVDYLHDYTMELEFSNGVDFAPERLYEVGKVA